METVKAPGLKWMKRAHGRRVPIWVADEQLVKAGYSPKTVNLADHVDTPDILIARCRALQADMELWRVGYRHDPLAFTGTIESLLIIYEKHPRSPFHALKPGTLVPYNHYIKRMKGHIGTYQLDEVSGIEILDWHDVWSENGKHLAAAAMARAVLLAALSFGIMLRLAGCAELSSVISETQKKLSRPQPRDEVVSADQIVALRKAAHAKGRPSSALAYALAFETTLRLWDTIGQWVPLDRPEISDVIDAERRRKWIGVRWEDIGADLVIRYTPSKTADTTALPIVYPLAKAPMVMEELAHWPIETRTGPLIRSEETEQPYIARRFGTRWKKDKKTAGIDDGVWARDLRASGITEGRAADASMDDAAKVAGHRGTKTTAKVYDRAVLEAADRFAEARIKGRERSGNSGGNGR